MTHQLAKATIRALVAGSRGVHMSRKEVEQVAAERSDARAAEIRRMAGRVAREHC